MPWVGGRTRAAEGAGRGEESEGMIAKEIRPSIGGGGYQRNKGTAGGKVRAISGKKSLVKGVGGGRYPASGKKRRRRRTRRGRGCKGSFLHYLETRRIEGRRGRDVALSRPLSSPLFLPIAIFPSFLSSSLVLARAQRESAIV